MASKKLPGRFTLQFNAADPHQKSVIDILNLQGRGKAQFVTTAVLHYINCTETRDYQAPVFNVVELERLVTEIIARKTDLTSKQAGANRMQDELQRETLASLVPPGDAILDREDLSAIARSLAAFRAE